jgi:hypothetical protein
MVVSDAFNTCGSIADPRSILSFLQGDAEKLKTFITEDKARIEAKYQSPLTLPSFHNFVVLSNNEKAVEVGQSERRFFMLQPKRKQYRKDEWKDMWYQVKDPTFQELFYQYLQTIDTSIITKGQAPMTAFKTHIRASQAPPTIRFLKELLYDPTLMQRPMANMNDQFRMQLLDEFSTKNRFALKNRAMLPTALENLVERQSEAELLQKELKTRNNIKTQVPQNHVIDCILQYFRGHAYVREDSESIRRVLTDMLELPISTLGMRDPAKPSDAKLSTFRSWVFPSIEGLRYILDSKGYMTANDDTDDVVETD